MKTINKKLEVGSLKVWHIPQIPGKPFEVYVDSLREGKKLMRILADYDLFQLEHNIKPDYANINGLSVLEKEEPMDEKERLKNEAEGVPPGHSWIDVEASFLWEEWEKLKNLEL